MVSCVKENWEPSAEMKRQYDELIKQMMLSGSSNILELSKLIASLVLIVNQHIEIKTEQYQRQCYELDQQVVIDEKKDDMREERAVRRSLEIVVDVFSKAASKLMGLDRDWQQVLDAQVYILEEILQP